MNKKTFGLLATLVAGAFVLQGCGSNPSTQEEPLSEAAQYCIDNGGEFNTVTSETAVYGECTLADGTVCEEWDYFNGDCPAVAEEGKTSLTLEELQEIAKNHLPLGYEYESYNIDNDEFISSGEYLYPENTDYSLLLPEHATMASQEIISSGIEDGMIYTNTRTELQDGTIIEILYINNPETLEFVAANAMNGSTSTRYGFLY